MCLLHIIAWVALSCVGLHAWVVWATFCNFVMIHRPAVVALRLWTEWKRRIGGARPNLKWSIATYRPELITVLGFCSVGVKTKPLLIICDLVGTECSFSSNARCRGNYENVNMRCLNTAYLPKYLHCVIPTFKLEFSKYPTGKDEIA